MKIPRFEGFISVITTPFDTDNAIDYGVLEQHIDFVIAGRVHANLPGESTGEYYAQSFPERRRVLEFVADKVCGRLPLYAGANSMQVDEIVALAGVAAELGYEAIMLAAPPYTLPCGPELVTHFRNVATRTSLPIILYNFPARTGVDMDLAFLEGLADVEAICAIKDSSGSFGRMLRHVVRFDGRYQRICGFDDQALDRCKELMQTMLPLIYLLENGGKNIQYVKFGCELPGIPVGYVRPPMGGPTTEEKGEFRRLYEDLRAAQIAA